MNELLTSIASRYGRLQRQAQSLAAVDHQPHLERPDLVRPIDLAIGSEAAALTLAYLLSVHELVDESFTCLPWTDLTERCQTAERFFDKPEQRPGEGPIRQALARIVFRCGSISSALADINRQNAINRNLQDGACIGSSLSRALKKLVEADDAMSRADQRLADLVSGYYQNARPSDLPEQIYNAAVPLRRLAAGFSELLQPRGADNDTPHGDIAAARAKDAAKAVAAAMRGLGVPGFTETTPDDSKGVAGTFHALIADIDRLIGQQFMRLTNEMTAAGLAKLAEAHALVSQALGALQTKAAA